MNANKRFGKKRRTNKSQKKTKPQLIKQTLKRVFLLTLYFFCTLSILLVVLLKFFPAPISSFMVHRHLDDYFADKPFKSIHYQWVDRENISKNAFAAAIAAEDQRFYQHHGIDLEAIFEAIDTYFEGGRLRGASTISQQVAKNLFLNPSRSFGRKLLEVWFTVLIELFWDKERILVMYLNIAELGDHVFGIEAASKLYFNVPAKKLTPKQAALLAATLPNPLLYHANQPSGYVLKRREWILRQMKNLNLFH